MSQTQKVIELNGRKITLVGTAHVSKESIEEVKQTINDLAPDCVAIELDEKRAESIRNPDRYKNLDIIKVLRKKEGFLLLANLILASFQRRMGANVGVKPGDEMLAALSLAEEKSIRTSLVDRPIQVTLKRAWAKNSFFGKCKLLAVLLSSAFSKEEIESEQIESLKQSNEMDTMMKELSGYLPVVKEVLIDERDQFLASKIYESEGKNIVAVLGAGHLPGVEAHLKKMGGGEEKSDVEEISKIPPKSLFSKISQFIIPAIIIALIIAGFIYKGAQTGKEILTLWILWNGVSAAIFTVFALAHPLTILTALLAAPFTSICPFIGVGFVAGIVQAIMRKPKVSDMETLQDDVSKFKGWYKNRLLRILLVFILSTIGSTIGTFVAGTKGIQKTFTEPEKIQPAEESENLNNFEGIIVKF